jgi:transcription initiation factor TFIID/TFIIF subunit
MASGLRGRKPSAAPTQIKRKVKIVTNQKINQNKPPAHEGFPMRDWSIEIYLLDEKKNEVPATIFDKVTYHLHESFGKKAKQEFKQPPFKLSEEGWGEFELELQLTPLGKGAPDVRVKHDLNFHESRYEVVQDLASRFSTWTVFNADRYSDVQES